METLRNINVPLFVGFLASLTALVAVVLTADAETAKAVQLDSLAFGLGTAVAGNAMPRRADGDQ